MVRGKAVPNLGGRMSGQMSRMWDVLGEGVLRMRVTWRREIPMDVMIGRD